MCITYEMDYFLIVYESSTTLQLSSRILSFVNGTGPHRIAFIQKDNNIMRRCITFVSIITMLIEIKIPASGTCEYVRQGLNNNVWK
jgi:hypothetical protein